VAKQPPNQGHLSFAPLKTQKSTQFADVPDWDAPEFALFTPEQSLTFSY
jgi:hypothetical protein